MRKVYCSNGARSFNDIAGMAGEILGLGVLLLGVLGMFGLPIIGMIEGFNQSRPFVEQEEELAFEEDGEFRTYDPTITD